MKCIRALFSVCLSFLFGSRSWSWCECGDRSVGTGTDGPPAGGIWLRLNVCFFLVFGSYLGSACWLSVLLVIVLGGDIGYSSWLFFLYMDRVIYIPGIFYHHLSFPAGGLPSAVFSWTSRGNTSVVPSPPRYVPSFFVAHRV